MKTSNPYETPAAVTGKDTPPGAPLRAKKVAKKAHCQGAPEEVVRVRVQAADNKVIKTPPQSPENPLGQRRRSERSTKQIQRFVAVYLLGST